MCAAFDACNNNKLIVLQHLILGVNTHINLDLGIAAAETSPGESIYDLQKDFEKINAVIASLTQAVQETLCNIWFPLRMIGKIVNNRQEAVLNFSIATARKTSWANAIALSIAGNEAKNNYINIMDNTVVSVAQRVINPGIATSFLLRPVRIMEDKDVRKIIDILQK